MKAVRVAIRRAVLAKRVQTLVVGAVAMLSTATADLGVGLLVVSQAPFARAFAEQAGAHTNAMFASSVDKAALAATARARSSPCTRVRRWWPRRSAPPPACRSATWWRYRSCVRPNVPTT
jgi:putative ABC transport system permease protein